MKTSELAHLHVSPSYKGVCGPGTPHGRTALELAKVPTSDRFGGASAERQTLHSPLDSPALKSKYRAWAEHEPEGQGRASAWGP